MIKTTTIALLAILALSVCSTSLYGGEGEDFFPPVSVTEHHKVLHRGVGTWKFEQKMWMTPGSEPIISHGTSVCKKILGGLGTTIHVQTKSAHGNFEGFGVYTWNTITEKYIASWVDLYSYNGIESMEGTYDAKTNAMTWNAMMTMPNGVKFPFKMVEKWLSDDKLVEEFYMPGKDGKIFKTMVNTCTRVD